MNCTDKKAVLSVSPNTPNAPMGSPFYMNTSREEWPTYGVLGHRGDRGDRGNQLRGDILGRSCRPGHSRADWAPSNPRESRPARACDNHARPVTLGESTQCLRSPTGRGTRRRIDPAAHLTERQEATASIGNSSHHQSRSSRAEGSPRNHSATHELGGNP